MWKSNLRSGSMLLGTACLFFIPSSAWAGGTAAGTTVQNTFTLNYEVSGVAQTEIDTASSPTEFTVDRLIDLTVASTGDTTVPPGGQNRDLVFSLTNEGNDTQAYSLLYVNESGDDFTATSPTLYYYVDDGDETFEPSGDDGSPQAYSAKTPDLAADAMLFVIVRANIPADRSDADQDSISLVADTLEPSSAGSSATPVVADSDGNSLTGNAENVLGDGSGTSNEVANAGDHSATGAFVVASADLDASKAVTVFAEDGTGCATIPGTPASGDQYAIPGACIQYVITVSNTGGTDATDVVINDVLSDELEFVAASASGFTGGSFASPSLPSANTDCNAGACVINFQSATLGSGTVPSPTQGTVTIRALVK